MDSPSPPIKHHHKIIEQTTKQKRYLKPSGAIHKSQPLFGNSTIMASEINQKILLLCSHDKNALGNRTTLLRLEKYLDDAGYSCSFKNAQNIDGSYWKTNKQFSCVLAIHALHCSNSLSNCPSPIILIFGGTDLNEFSKKSSNLKTMTEIVEKAHFTVTFGPSMTQKALSIWPNLIEKLKEIPQAIDTKPSCFDLKDYLKTNNQIDPTNIFLLVAGIRPVKDLLYLLPTFQKWHKSSDNSYLIIIGNDQNKDYYKVVKEEIEKCSAIVLLPELPREDILACMKGSFALVNSSISEGMSAAVLEAMSLNLPVIARDIPGNRDLITDNITGCLYKNPDEFITKARLLMNNANLRNEIFKNAKEKIDKYHSMDVEAKAYYDILSTL